MRPRQRVARRTRRAGEGAVAVDAVAGHPDVVARSRPTQRNTRRRPRPDRQPTRDTRRARVRAGARGGSRGRLRRAVTGRINGINSNRVQGPATEPTHRVARPSRRTDESAVAVHPVPRHPHVVARGRPQDTDARLGRTRHRTTNPALTARSYPDRRWWRRRRWPWPSGCRQRRQRRRRPSRRSRR